MLNQNEVRVEELVPHDGSHFVVSDVIHSATMMVRKSGKTIWVDFKRNKDWEFDSFLDAVAAFKKRSLELA